MNIQTLIETVEGYTFEPSLIEEIQEPEFNGIGSRGKPYPYKWQKFTEWMVTGAAFRSQRSNRFVVPVKCSCGATGEKTPCELEAELSKRCSKCARKEARRTQRARRLDK